MQHPFLVIASIFVVIYALSIRSSPNSAWIPALLAGVAGILVGFGWETIRGLF